MATSAASGGVDGSALDAEVQGHRHRREPRRGPRLRKVAPQPRQGTTDEVAVALARVI